MRIVSIGMIVLGAGMACGQSIPAGSGQAYPIRPIRIVTSAAGGGSDFPARIIAQALVGPLGQPVIVDNRGGNIGPEEVMSKAQSDGYTLLYSGSGLWVQPLLQKTPYDALKDFAPITLALMSANILVVNPAVPATSTKELIALAKAKPGALNYASASSGSSSHLAGELFKAMASVNIVHVPYKGTAPAVNDVIGGQVQLMFTLLTSAVPHIKSGRLRALAVTSDRPSALFPELPTIAASGVPGYEAVQRSGMFAPAKTPMTVINRLNSEIVRFLASPEAKERFSAVGAEIIGSTPEQFAAAIKSEVARLGKVVKEAGIHAG